MSKTVESIIKQRGMLKPSVREGIARLFDFNGVLSPKFHYQNSEQTDYEALKSDWEAVGEDIKLAVKEYQN